jgi:hypothetical protein
MFFRILEEGKGSKERMSRAESKNIWRVGDREGGEGRASGGTGGGVNNSVQVGRARDYPRFLTLQMRKPVHVTISTHRLHHADEFWRSCTTSGQ